MLIHHLLYGISQENAMDHGEALKMMAAERYLLDELTPEQKDAFEEHLFSCDECALDLRAGAAFMSEAKVQLAELKPQAAALREKPLPANPVPKKKGWSFLWQPAFALPAFAVMLTVIAYQNFSAIPSLRRAATEPRILYSNPLHVGTRGSAHTSVQADPQQGLALSLELPQTQGYSAYVFDLYDQNQKHLWTRIVSRSSGDDGIVSLIIPGSGLQAASYTLAISGITPQNGRVELDRRVLDVQFGN